MTRVKDIMQPEVITVARGDSVAHLIRTLETRGITGVPVTDEDGGLAGVVSSRDVMRLARDLDEVPEAVRWGLSLGTGPREGLLLDTPEEGEFFAYYVTPQGGFVDVQDRIRELSGDIFEGYRVEDIMTPAPVTVPEDATIQELARLLRDRRIHRALVVRQGKLAGIVTSMDLLGALADT